MVSTKALAKKILSGLSNPAVDNEIWLRDVLGRRMRLLAGWFDETQGL